MRDFTARPYQHLITNYIVGHPRCAVWAGMGVGKSISTLNAIDTVMVLEDVKVLIVAPLRVARTTWPDEVRKWRHLRHLRLVAITGSAAERTRALKIPADIYTTNFESLPWLVEYWGDKWPYDWVVVDESTKLKGFRLRQGTARAKALGRVAHTKVKRLTQLTGTPSPNGLADLWGQLWFVDKGQRLGRTYDDFRMRWFEKSYDGYSITAKDHAQAQIQRALADVCITIDAKDWFDLREPVVNNIYVDLPARAQALYEDMEKRMFMELDEHEVEAFGAAARTVKCIAAGTEVLTSNGWKPIERWQPGDMLWDGVEWVNADKLVCNGVMPVVKCLQVSMTPDHKVLTTNGWRTAEEINNANASEGYDRLTVRIPDGTTSRRDDSKYYSEESDMDSQMYLWQRDNRHWYQPTQSQSWREKIMRLPPARDVAGSLGFTRHVQAPRLHHMAADEIEMFESLRQRLAELWRAGDKGLLTLEEFPNLLERYGQGLHPGIDLGAGQQQRPLRTRKLPVGESTGPGEQHPAQRAYRNPSRSDDGISSSGALRHQTGDAGAAAALGLADGTRADTALVYDLVNCGPRHRFTVRGADGQLLIVHNCLQIANGAAYVGEDTREWQPIHDEKLAALEEVVEEACGVPVLVAYQFKSDLARLQKAFPDGIHLSSDDGLRRAQRGEGRVWFGHPASMGHGVDGLQEHCNILCFFGMDWNLENRLQIIERVGPTRQMQAGKDRAVFIHNILARGTVDEMVLERVNTKREVQDILLAAMKRKKEIA